MKSVKYHNKLRQLLLIKNSTFLIVFLFSFFAHSQNIDKTRQEEGQKLFKSLCASCHKLDKKFIGPAMANIEDKRTNKWLKAWIKDNEALRASGDKDAIAIFKEYNETPMNAFPQLTDEDIDKILYYTTVGEIKKEIKPVVEEAVATSTKVKAPKWLVWILATAIVVAFLMIMSLLKTIYELKTSVNTTSENKPLEFWEAVKQNTYLQVLTTIFIALVTAYFVFGNMFKIGVDKGYQPIQPIMFSHKIHSGDNKIDCQYCHSAAKHSKHSGIPSVSVCMNCHKNISEVAEDTKVVMEDGNIVLGKAELDKEIQKIYKAAGWDAENLVYTGKTEPIKWVRVHNLPDFAYYNHSQHVTVAGLDCQKCHGPVEEMHEVYQFSPLTMGWCIDCHKQSEVDLKGNEYYAKIHKELAEKYNVQNVTIDMLGGKECGKCHY